MLDKSHATVRTMFGDIAGRYDLLNHLLSANQDKIWRRRAVAQLAPRRRETILDLCCGTGDLGFAIQHRQPKCHVIGADFAVPMLRLAREKSAANSPVFLAADALRLPFGDRSFDGAAIGFGVRNWENTRAGLEELRRVVKPNGRLLILEFMRPTSPAVQKFFGLFNLALAPLGRAVSGHATAYNYLPQSVEGFYTKGEFADLLRSVGWKNVRSFNFSGGIATSFLAHR